MKHDIRMYPHGVVIILLIIYYYELRTGWKFSGEKKPGGAGTRRSTHGTGTRASGGPHDTSDKLTQITDEPFETMVAHSKNRASGPRGWPPEVAGFRSLVVLYALLLECESVPGLLVLWL